MAGHDTGPARSRLVLIGPMGAGKTTIGKRVARALSAEFIDSDAEFVRVHGPIAAYFEAHGEIAFRREERSIVARVLQRSAVLSLGGGAVLDPETRVDLGSVPVVLLTATADAVRGRLGSGTRPLVRGGIADWTRIMEQRRPIYEALADSVIDTSRRPITVIAAEIAEWLRAQSSSAPPSDPAAVGCPSGRQS
ncbi:shikimate kinase [Rathayibacter iranicus]|uniref:Shikimate kinase n=2 Tax=Rathayibacter iranicus TaxID=59737 RepID=A0AAD1ACR9_9MICO|nr:shikimate kinase [Rathayibacter iranicus]AZZ55087.1 shikimate kinase [Rathayibacter iranicus]MWV32508.1 AAA family ATPase [Rathayibacter iranicus NCPPB 2253 = VKM Ac-1602]PPI50122.1 shikimate kinase [Rathayibacter iranicus]PPI61896.1 shikimate kinase [Rathayibacter iranicus]PPI73601.1 shikimate kinase [Rathayibacter iranicus]